MEKYVDKNEYTELPFKVSVLDSQPVEVTNPYSGQSVLLTPTEVAVYDVTMGSYHMGLYDTFYKGKNWFMENNIEAYMTLID